MDPITAIVTALALGAAAGFKDTAEQAVKDGYAALKQLILRKRPQSSASITQLEQRPSSSEQRSAVGSELAASGVEQDSEIVQKAESLLAVVKTSDIDAARLIGVDLRDIEAAGVTLQDILVRGDGTGVRAEKVKASGDFTIKNVTVEGSRKN